MIDRYKLCKKIFKRFDGEIKQSTIFEAMCVIIEYLKEEIINDKTITVENFGTITTRIRKARLNTSPIVPQEIFEAKRYVKFYPHYIFESLLKTSSRKRLKKILGGARKV